MVSKQKLDQTKQPPVCVFDGVREDINAITEPKKRLAEISDKDFLQPLLNAKSLKAFFVWYVNNPYFHEALSYAVMMADIPNRLTAISIFSEEGDTALKSVEQHLLTRKEFQEAQHYLVNTNRSMLYAASIIEQGLGVFLEHLSENLDSISPYLAISPITTSAHRALDTLKGTLWISAVTQEFMPVIALHCARMERENLEKEMAKGLKKCFSQRSAFDSETQGGRITCPIKGSIGHLVNMTLEKNESGPWVEGRPKHGGLILSLMDIIKNWEQSPPAHKIAHDII